MDSPLHSLAASCKMQQLLLRSRSYTPTAWGRNQSRQFACTTSRSKHKRLNAQLVAHAYLALSHQGLLRCMSFASLVNIPKLLLSFLAVGTAQAFHELLSCCGASGCVQLGVFPEGLGLAATQHMREGEVRAA